MARTKSRSGYLLLEAMFALTLLAIGLTAFNESFSLAQLNAKRTQQLNLAADCVQRHALEKFCAILIPNSACDNVSSEEEFKIVLP